MAAIAEPHDIEAGGDIGPLAATAGEGDVNMPAAGAGVEEEVGGIRAARAVGIGRAKSHRRSVGAVKNRRLGD